MNAGWWWIDRWRKSTAYTDMTLEEQGAYRNLLDELWLRGGALPNDERILAKVCGDALAWPRIRTAVMVRFEVTADGLRNATHDEVSAQSKRRADNQKRYRERKIHKDDNSDYNTRNNRRVNKPASPEPEPEPEPDQSLSPDLSPWNGDGNGNGVGSMEVELLVTDIVTVTDEPTTQARKLVRAIPPRCWESTVIRALAETRTAKLAHEVKKTPGAMFFDLAHRFCDEQGLKWPFTSKRGTKGDTP